MQLTPNFSLSTGSYSVMKFPSGEIQVTVANFIQQHKDNSLRISGSILTSDHLIELLQLVEAIRFENPLLSDISFVMPYCAYSRQDRRCNSGESFSLKVFAQLLNSCNFSSVFTWDNHSDVSTALINNCVNYSVDKLLNLHKKKLGITTYDFFVSPDAGANKKVQACSKQFNIPMLRADKIRDTAIGRILETILYATPNELLGKRVLIIDDICDGGRTFTELAKAIHLIQPDCIVELYVTHGFFSKGIDPLIESGINHIYTTDSVCTISHPNLTVLD